MAYNDTNNQPTRPAKVGEKGIKMKITQTDHAWREPQTVVYTDDAMDIRDAAAKYGRSDDTIRIYDGDRLTAIATWPQGYKAYKYCTDPDNAHDPRAWTY